MSIKNSLKRIAPCTIYRSDRGFESVRKKFENQNKKIVNLENRVMNLENRNQRLQRELSEQTRKQYYYYCVNLPEERYAEELKKWYYRHLGKRLDFTNPKTYNEKIQWLKLYGINGEIVNLADKIKVRNYVANKIGEKYLNPLLGTWDYPEEIDFDALPDRFVLKANHGSGYNCIVRDKQTQDLEELCKRANAWLEEDFSFCNGFEMQYHDIKRKLLAETYIENRDGDLYDFKVWCFNGRAEYIQFLSNRHHGLKMSFYDREWNWLPFVYDHPRHDAAIERPNNLDELIDVAERLAQGFPHVRVDFYRLNDGKLYFSEMTFTPASGRCGWKPNETDAELGRLFDLKSSRLE